MSQKLSQEERESIRTSFMETVNRVDPDLPLRMTSDAPGRIFLQHIQTQQPLLYQDLETNSLLLEAAMVAQARYEEMRDQLLSQGASPTVAREMAWSEFITPRPPSLESENQITDAQEAEARMAATMLLGRPPQIHMRVIETV